jgi:cyclophilin family peptidyl-prolyl cis-trans isomerase
MYRKLSLLIFATSCAMILSGCTAKQNTSNVKLIEEGNTMNNNTTPTSKPATPSASAPEMEIDTKKSYTAVFKTEMGEMTVELNAKETPITVNNFVHLAKENFYDNTVFHRTISGFMIQGGDPKGDGTGGPGYKFADEPFQGEYTRGTIAMANSGPNTNGSQFFIMHQDYPLPKNYVIFGKVVKGLDVVDKIATATVKQNPYTGEMSVPVNPVKVNTVEIIEK